MNFARNLRKFTTKYLGFGNNELGARRKCPKNPTKVSFRKIQMRSSSSFVEIGKITYTITNSYKYKYNLQQNKFQKAPNDY